ncbi:MAG: extensin family protein [Pontixanthobacter sp.]
MRTNVEQCRAVLDRSGIAFLALEPTGEGACARPDRTRLADYPFANSTPATTCPLAASMEMWLRQSVQPAAERIFGQNVSTIRHLGAYSCRRLYGRGSGPWSEHATGNAIDIAGFTLVDGTEISLLADWDGSPNNTEFLREIRDGACGLFGTVLSPDYNAAHRDHFHFDQADRVWQTCR